MKFENVSPAQMTALREKLTTTHQASVTGTTAGQIMGHGVVANYAYDATNQALTVDVQHHPFFMPESAIHAGIAHALGQEKQATAGA